MDCECDQTRVSWCYGGRNDMDDGQQTTKPSNLGVKITCVVLMVSASSFGEDR